MKHSAWLNRGVIPKQGNIIEGKLQRLVSGRSQGGGDGLIRHAPLLHWLHHQLCPRRNHAGLGAHLYIRTAIRLLKGLAGNQPDTVHPAILIICRQSQRIAAIKLQRSPKGKLSIRLSPVDARLLQISLHPSIYRHLVILIALYPNGQVIRPLLKALIIRNLKHDCVFGSQVRSSSSVFGYRIEVLPFQLPVVFSSDDIDAVFYKLELQIIP